MRPFSDRYRSIQTVPSSFRATDSAGYPGEAGGSRKRAWNSAPVLEKLAGATRQSVGIGSLSSAVVICAAGGASDAGGVLDVDSFGALAEMVGTGSAVASGNDAADALGSAGEGSGAGAT